MLPHLLRELLLDLAALIWPTACVSCGAPDRDCCAVCTVEVRAAAPPRLFDTAGVPSLACASYTGALRAALIAFKHGGRFGFAQDLGRRFAPTLGAALGASAATPIIVTMPSRPRSVRRRGYRHLDVLVTRALRCASAHSGRPRAPRALRAGPPSVARVRALRTTRGRTGQVGLGPREREVNARRIAVRRSAAARLRGREIVLVDDVITTGASVRAARDALEQAGARVIAVAALCVSERRDSDESSANSASNSGGGGNAGDGWSRVRERRNGAPDGTPA